MGYRPAYNEIFDHVLLMGPLYHLLEAHERETAMCAALSRLKPGGTIAVSFIGSYSGMLYAMRALLKVILRAKEQEYFESLVQGQAFAGTGFTDVYFERHQRVLPFMGKFQLETLHFLSSESFFAPCSDRLYAQSEETYQAWLRFGIRLCELPDALPFAEHLLYIGRKPKEEHKCK